MISVARLSIADWPWIERNLAPLHFDRPEMHGRIASGDWAAFRITGGGEVCLVASWGFVEGRKALWVEQMAGRIEGGPRAKREKIGDMMSFLEDQARKNGCMEIRVLGRMAWRRLLPAFELTEYRGNPVLRKVLQ